ncbi:hypothetical protein B0J11DRAFT_111677 [Dendryphion nanum]|uniref:Glycosyl transferase CAP10 domain-containing protein n=1 Tax=Dendryphion nanum TaxID=256645 RepID=A0A9P9D8T1_9PLEO|nr:hypothetical protein B0J11DRAFT_111677 [Dendryphion nanum]
MHSVDTGNFRSLTWATAAALFTAQIYPRETQGNIPICSETICWILVVTFFELVPHLWNGAFKDNQVIFEAPIRLLPWMIAASISVSTISFSFDDSSWVIPAITPILVGLRRTMLLPSLRQSHPEHIRSVVWLPFVIGAVSVIVLAPPLDLGRIAFAGPALVGLAGTYAFLIHMFESEIGNTGPPATSGCVRIVRAIAYRTIGTLVISAIVLMFLLLPGTTPNLGRALLAGFVKAAHWIIALWLTQHIPWETVTTLWTCAVASRVSFVTNASASLGLFQTLARFSVAILAVYQTITFLPKTTQSRYMLYVFAIWPLLSLVQHPPFYGKVAFLPGEVWTQNPVTSSPKPSLRHPIEELVLKAQIDFTHLVERQSKTLQEAELEYRKRYSRDPPPGFEKWFDFARLKESVFIDDFDMINEDLKPFWKISPQKLLEAIDHVTSFEYLALRKCGFTNGEYHGQGGGWIVDDLGHLLEEVSRDLPDVEFAFDVVDEPRVIITEQMLEDGGTSKPEFQNADHASIWEQVTASCQDSIPKSYQDTVYDYGLPFVQDWHQAKDVCNHPEFSKMHGFFSSPETCILTDAPIPVLSQAAPTSFGDIMYPSPWYTEKQDQGNYKDEEDPPWEQKHNTLYWAGSTTGSHSRDGSWHYSHRQRFVTLVQSLNETTHKYLKQVRTGVWDGYEAEESHQDLFDVKLTAIIQCDEKDCDEQRRLFRLGEKEDRNKQFQSKFIFDLDGNSFSGRYYTLLQSRSVVLKQTVLREWHDERLVPWIHFVPISLSMMELPEVMKYLTSVEGELRAQEIANASREWHAKVLRREDFTIYLYRLMLELARIMDPNRKME